MLNDGTPLDRRNAGSRQWLPIALLVGYLAVWFTLTHLPHVPSPPGPASWDKAAHFAGYAVLAALLWWNANRLGQPGMVLIWVLVALVAIIGGVDEWTQGFVPGRHAEWQDWYADLLGAVTGLLVAGAVSRFLR